MWDSGGSLASQPRLSSNPQIPGEAVFQNKKKVVGNEERLKPRLSSGLQAHT